MVGRKLEGGVSRKRAKIRWDLNYLLSEINDEAKNQKFGLEAKSLASRMQEAAMERCKTWECAARGPVEGGRGSLDA